MINKSKKRPFFLSDIFFTIFVFVACIGGILFFALLNELLLSAMRERMLVKYPNIGSQLKLWCQVMRWPLNFFTSTAVAALVSWLLTLFMKALHSYSRMEDPPFGPRNMDC